MFFVLAKQAVFKAKENKSGEHGQVYSNFILILEPGSH